jgi:hypothetical protein
MAGSSPAMTGEAMDGTPRHFVEWYGHLKKALHPQHNGSEDRRYPCFGN